MIQSDAAVVWTGSVAFEPRGFEPTTVPALPGVYLIANEAGQPILLAHSQDMRRAIRGRFTASSAVEPSKRIDLAPIAARVQWRLTRSAFETTLLHMIAARAIYPRDYQSRLGLAPAWFLHVNSADEFPRFVATKSLDASAHQLVGPFPSRTHADRYSQMLEDLFDLCRYHHILRQAPAGVPCAYRDMGRCDAPCNGSATMASYRGLIDQALDFAVAGKSVTQHMAEAIAPRGRDRLTVLQRMMREAASEQRFERAASLRETLNRTTKTMSGRGFEHVGSLSGFQWLILQRSPVRGQHGARLIRPFVVIERRLTAYPDVDVGTGAIGKIEQLAGLWRDGAAPPNATLDTTCDENVWLTARFLFDARPVRGVFIPLQQVPSQTDWSRRLAPLWSEGAGEPPITGMDALTSHDDSTTA